MTWGDLNSRPMYANLQRDWCIDGLIGGLVYTLAPVVTVLWTADNIGDLTKMRGKHRSLFQPAS